MELKTKINAEDGKHDILITREFDLSVQLLFKAYTEASLFEQWMGTRVTKLESKTHGSYAFETSDPKGNVVFKANGVIHEFIPDKKITRTFEMENTRFPVQLEYLEFEQMSDSSSKLTIHTIFKSTEYRDQLLKLPFAQGINIAHNRLQDIVNKLK